MGSIIKQTTRFGVNALFDQFKARYDLPSDAALGRLLEVTSPMISKLRAGSPLTPTMALRIHECTGLPLRDIYDIASRSEEPEC